MAHYRMLDRVPAAVITSNRNELKLYDGNVVYLNNGDNFELRFFNPLPEKIGVEIIFNGIKKGDSYLVLNPGQDVILDRFIDEQRKMLFETYTIDGNNEAAVDAIVKNGVINFNFYKENKWGYSPNFPSSWNGMISGSTMTTTTTTTTNTTYGYPTGTSTTNTRSMSGGLYTNSGFSGAGGGRLGHFTNVSSAQDLWEPIYKNSTDENGNPVDKEGNVITDGRNGARGSNGAPGSPEKFTKKWAPIKGGNKKYKSAGVHTTEMDNTNIDYSDYLAESTSNPIDYEGYICRNLNGMGSVNYSKDYWFPSSNPIETGRIEKGELSNQQLKEVELQFAPTPFYSMTYKMVPNSARPQQVNEIRQYCPECGYRLRKQTWSYCPKCGERL